MNKQSGISRCKMSPSLMCMNFLDIKSDLDVFIEEKVDYLHIDIMDGHYVPNFTLGINFCKVISAYIDIPLDIHLMIDNPDSFVEEFTRFKNSIVTFHPETVPHPIATIQRIKHGGARAGIALDPVIPIEQVKYLLPDVDLVGIMTVNPGYAGQKIIPQTIGKIAEVATYLKEKGYTCEIEVDGNVSWQNLPRMIEAGGEVFVAGTSSIFEKGGSLRNNVRRFRSIINGYCRRF